MWTGSGTGPPSTHIHVHTSLFLDVGGRRDKVTDLVVRVTVDLGAMESTSSLHRLVGRAEGETSPAS